jgi:hypothetical protein
VTARRSTSDHATIRRWVEARGGHPAVVTGTAGEGDDVLRLDLPPGFSGQEFLEPISWEDFFAIFEEKRLAFVYEDEGRFFELVPR